MARATSERKFTELKTPHCVVVFMQALGRKGGKGAKGNRRGCQDSL